MATDNTGFKGFESPNYTQTPNDFFDEVLLSKDITLAEIKILGFMIRYTYGWQRAGNSLQFSFTELQKACHLGREAVNNGLKKLLSKNYIQRKEIDGHMKYRLHIKEFSDYPWSVEFNWKQVYKVNGKTNEPVEKEGQFDNRTSNKKEGSSEIEPVSVRKSNQYQFDNRTSKNPEFVEPQEVQDSPKKNLNKRNKLDTLLDTEHTKELLEELRNNPAMKKQAEDKLMKEGLKEYIPESIHKSLVVFSGNYQQMYDWLGILFRAKKKVCEEENVLITFEDFDKEINEILLSALRKIKTDQRIKNPNNYLYITFCKEFSKIAGELNRDRNQKAVYYNWLEE